MNSSGTLTLISSSSDCSSSFYGSCEVTAQVRKVNLTVLSGDGKLRKVNLTVLSGDGKLWKVNLTVLSGDGKLHKVNLTVLSGDSKLRKVNLTVLSGDGKLWKANLTVLSQTSSSGCVVRAIQLVETRLSAVHFIDLLQKQILLPAAYIQQRASLQPVCVYLCEGTTLQH
jgi:hypothetical protein